MTSRCSCRPPVDPRLWSGANLTRGTVVCGPAPHCGSECRFQHSPLPVRYATIQSPFRCVSSLPLPPDQPSSSRFSVRRVASLMVLRSEPTCWPPILRSRSSISATSLQRTRILEHLGEVFPVEHIRQHMREIERL